MGGIFFKPWKGAKYESNNLIGKRVLVLGEAHYEWDKNIPLSPDLTIDCVREQTERVYTSKFWTNIAVAFLNKRPSLEEKKEFWNSVAFFTTSSKRVSALDPLSGQNQKCGVIVSKASSKCWQSCFRESLSSLDIL